MRRRFLRTPSTTAFTLIELLVVIVILGILMAVALPTFLKQQTKAQDSRTQQYLTTAYKAIRGGTPETSNLYPSSTSMVSWVQQSEPELTVQRSSCYTGAPTAPADAVLVDPSSSAKSLLLCSRSASGNMWELSATATGAPTLINGTLVPLTFSGNEITDASRAAGNQGDGLQNDSSTGVWQATTNLVPNGGFEINTNGWQSTSAGGTTLAQDTNMAKFGSASLKVTTDGTSSGQGAQMAKFSIATVNGDTYTDSAWVLAPSGAGMTLVLERNNAGSCTTNFTGTGAWQNVSVTCVVSATSAWPHVQTNGSEAITFWVDGVQQEQSPVATPYVETSGSIASRSVAAVQAPASLITSPSQTFWVAERVRLGYTIATNIPYGNGNEAIFFDWGSDTQNHVTLMEAYNSTWRTYLYAGGVSHYIATTASGSAGSYVTLISTVAPTQIGISANGGAFSTLTISSLPSFTLPSFAIGTSSVNPGNEDADSDVLWFACGTGSLTNADAATISALGNTDPTRASFPSSAQVTMTWDGTSTTGSLK